MRIEIPIFDGFDDLDAIGPYEVMRTAADLGASWDVAIVGARSDAPVRSHHGLLIAVDGTIGRPDALIVPGGGWNTRGERGSWAEAQLGVLPKLVAERAADCSWVASVCTGAMLLSAAGLIGSRPATTHHQALDELAAGGAQVMADYRVVDDGDLITCAGITAGIDLALWMVERELGRQMAQAVAREIEHERSPLVWAGGGE
jgi:transcriptional regulator GlxA family with amidase domain